MKRNKILYFGLLVLLIVLCGNSVLLLLFGERTEGIVVDIKHNYMTNSRSTQSVKDVIAMPQVQFILGNDSITFTAGYYINYKIGEKVPVLYFESWPQEAKTLSFKSLFLVRLGIFALAGIFWMIIITSFFPKTQTKKANYFIGTKAKQYKKL